MMELKDFRDKIDEIDKEIVSLFCRRMDISHEIGEFKRVNSIPVIDRTRELEKLQSIQEDCPDEYRHAIKELYEKIFDLSRSTQQLKCGLVGLKLGHSYSPFIHSQMADYEYSLWEKRPEELEDFIKNGDWHGLNVTMPYKKTLMPFCSRLSDRAKRVGSVNTLLKTGDGIYGDNTDEFGFEKLIEKLNVSVKGRKALVFGSGGVSNAVCEALRKYEIGELCVVSRSGKNNYENISRHYDSEIIVNATPLGMYPHNGSSPVDLSLFKQCRAVFDVVYNPVRTALIMQAEELNIPCAGGLYMLVSQAQRSAELFSGKEIPEGKIDEIYSQLKLDMENIVLIGMPGSGKTTVGKLISYMTGRKFYDSDYIIEQKAGMSIPEIFASSGEEGFRRLETQTLSELGMLSGAVIATGGGAVTKRENYPLLHQNSKIFYLRRELEKLDCSGRPLSLNKGNARLYQERKELYTAFADMEISCDDTAESCAECILEALK